MDQDKMAYKTAQKNYRSLIKDYFDHKESKIIASGSNRLFWNYCRRNMKKLNSTPTIVDNEGYVLSENDTANVFNDYFQSLFVSDYDCDDVSNILEVTDNMKPFRGKINFDVVDIFNILQSLPAKLSAGPDGIPQIIYKRCALSLALPLYLLFNEILNEGKNPKIWKTSLITPIHKGGDINENSKKASSVSIFRRKLNSDEIALILNKN